MKTFKFCSWVMLLCILPWQVHATVKGHVGSVTANNNNGVEIKGWACDSGVNQSIAVDYYLGAPVGQGPIFTTAVAAETSEPAVATACNNSFYNHRMTLTLTNAQWLTHAGETVYAYGVSTSGGANNELVSSGSFTIPAYVAPPGEVQGHIDSVLANASDGVSIKGWACDYGINQSINVHFYLDQPAGQGSIFANIVADDSSESGVATVCGTSFNNHRFSFDLTTAQWQANSGYAVYAYGISTTGGTNNELEVSGVFNIPDYEWGLSDFNISAGADFTVAAGSSVIIDSSVDIGTLTIAGDLVCEDSTASYDLDAQKIVVADGGRFICGSESERFGGQLNIRMKAGLERAIMVTSGGQLMLFGEDQSSGFERINQTAIPGDDSIVLATPVEWNVGDTVVLASSGFDMNEAEQLTVSAISTDKLTVWFDTPLVYQHYGQLQPFSAPGKTWTLDQRSFVANLSRNIKVSSYLGDHQTSKLGAHMMTMVGGQAFVDGVEFIEMGRLGELGRYPFHWHHVGDALGQYIKNSVIRDSYQRCIVLHDTDYATVSNNVCYNHNGHGIFLESGSERKNVISDNLVLVSKKIDAAIALLISEVVGVASRFPAPSSYWISNPDNTVTGNVAAGSEGTGFWMAFEKASKCSSGSLGCSKPVETDTLAFDNNIAHSSLVGITWDGAPSGAPINGDANNLTLQNAHYAPPTKPQFNGLVYYKNAESGVYFRGDAATFEGNIAADNRWNLFFAYSQQYRNGAVIGKSASFTHQDLVTLGNKSGAQLAGILLYDGPFELENVDFLNFPATVETYNGKNVTPIPFVNTGGANRFENKVTGLTFTPEPNKRIFWQPNNNWDDTSYSTSLRDIDGSLTGTAGKLVVHDIAFNQHASCSSQSTWQALVCDYAPVLYTIDNVSHDAAYFSVINPAGVQVTSIVSTATQHHNKFNAIPGGTGFYTMVPGTDLMADNAFDIVIQAEGNGVLGPVVKLENKDCTLAGLTGHRNLADLTASSEAGYYLDGSSTYFKFKTSVLFPTHVNAALSNVYYSSVNFSCN